MKRTTDASTPTKTPGTSACSSRSSPPRTAPTTPKLARECSDVKLDRAYVGSCTGGKITDMIFAAAILAGETVRIPTFVVPGSTEVHADMLKLNVYGLPLSQTPRRAGEALGKSFDPDKSIEQTLLDAGCNMGASSCAACLGGPQDTFGRLNEAITCISTTNRNFPGRMGHKQAGVYLASPLTAAASALTGHVTDPREYVTAPIYTGTAGDRVSEVNSGDRVAG